MMLSRDGEISGPPPRIPVLYDVILPCDVKMWLREKNYLKFNIIKNDYK